MKTWNLDKAHSEIEFKVRHMMISSVKGFFQDFDIEVTGDPTDISNGTVKVTIAAASINTKNEQRDQHLRSEDFFNCNEFPEISFASTQISKLNDNKYDIIGNLTIKNITKAITFNIEMGGSAKDPWGNDKTGFTFHGKVNREEFGLTWNTALETGGVMVGEEVKIQGDLQFTLS